MTKGYIIFYSKNKTLLKEAIKMGCKTASDFAIFLKVREYLLAS